MKSRLVSSWAALALLLAAAVLGCEEKGPPRAASPRPARVPAPAPEADADFPAWGLRAIFRSDFPFVNEAGDVGPVSVPPTRLGCGIKLLADGAERLRRRLELLDRSKKSVRIQTYIFTADEAGKTIAAALKKKRAIGHDLRLTVDCYNKFMPADRLMYNDLELAGIQVMGLEPILLTGVAENKLFNLDDVNMRFHEKYFVIDDEVAIVGGTNIANEYYHHGDDPAAWWRDQDALLTGPVVADVARAFDDNHEYFKLRRAGRLPTNRAAWFSKAWWEISGTAPPPIAAQPPRPGGQLPDLELDAANVPIRFLRHRPRQGEDYIFQAYLHLFDHAEKSILIENAYFVPNRALLNALMKAARRGVAVTIITNSEETNDVKGMQSLSRYVYFGLIHNGAEVYEWLGEQPGRGCLHSKFAVIDQRVAVIGSCNLDPRSLGINSEDVVIIDSAPVAKKLSQTAFELDLPHSRKIALDEARKWRDPNTIDEKFKLTFGKTLEDWY